MRYYKPVYFPKPKHTDTVWEPIVKLCQLVQPEHLNHFNKVGAMRFFTNNFCNSDACYEPNTKGGAVEDFSVGELPMKISGDIMRSEENDTFGVHKQPRDMFRLFNYAQKE